MSALGHAVVTPVRDEVAGISRLSKVLAAQTRPPLRWVIVDNGSTDGSLELAKRLSARLPWIAVASAPAAERAQPGGPVVRAFHTGLALVPPEATVVTKLDADVDLDLDYFARLLDAFIADDGLGIAGGACLEERHGRWRRVSVASDHVRGAARSYRRECLEAILPLEERVGWDGIDAVKAQLRGWRVAPLPNLSFRHLRPLGVRDGRRWTRWARQGSGARYMGYGAGYVVARALYRAARDPMALAMIAGYAGASLRQEARCADVAVRQEIRARQRRSLTARVSAGERAR